MSEARVRPPSTLHVRLDERSSVPPICRNEPAFTIIRLESSVGLQGRIRKVSAIPALLVSVSIKPLPLDRYALWIADRLVPTPGVSAFRANVIDFDAQPSCRGCAGFAFCRLHGSRQNPQDR